jgi:hypothetical protein
MNRTELLTFSAKAIGIEFNPQNDYTEGIYLQNGKLWNPLDNGSDAFGLMIRLKLSCDQYPECVTVKFSKTHLPLELISDPGLSESVSGEDDAYRGWVTRKLIVTAAARLGKYKV